MRYFSATPAISTGRLSAEQWHSVHPDKFPTVTSVNAVIQANGSRFIMADTRAKKKNKIIFRLGRLEAPRPAARMNAVCSARLAVSSLHPGSKVFAATEFRSLTAMESRLTAAMPLPHSSVLAALLPAFPHPKQRRKVDGPFCFPRAGTCCGLTGLINLPWSAPFNDCSVNNKFPWSCLKVYRVCALSGEPRAF